MKISSKRRRKKEQIKSHNNKLFNFQLRIYSSIFKHQDIPPPITVYVYILHCRSYWCTRNCFLSSILKIHPIFTLKNVFVVILEEDEVFSHFERSLVMSKCDSHDE